MRGERITLIQIELPALCLAAKVMRVIFGSPVERSLGIPPPHLLIFTAPTRPLPTHDPSIGEVPDSHVPCSTEDRNPRIFADITGMYLGK